jgi:hypothetical protein
VYSAYIKAAGAIAAGFPTVPTEEGAFCAAGWRATLFHFLTERARLQPDDIARRLMRGGELYREVQREMNASRLKFAEHAEITASDAARLLPVMPAHPPALENAPPAISTLKPTHHRATKALATGASRK